MSDFYSRCLVCGVDLPRGCSFCTEAHKLRWKAEHDEEARPVVLIDEWPFVERETIVSGASGASTARQSAASEGTRSQGETPAVCSGWACHDPQCTHPNCNPAF